MKSEDKLIWVEGGKPLAWSSEKAFPRRSDCPENSASQIRSSPVHFDRQRVSKLQM